MVNVVVSPPRKTVPTPLVVVAAAALIDAAGHVLVQQRPAGKAMAGLWEFPGGKVERGETPEAALVRELHEELGIVVDGGALTASTFTSASLGGGHLLLLLYLCRAWNGTPRALEADALLWCPPAALHGLKMPPADLPFVAVLEATLAIA